MHAQYRYNAEGARSSKTVDGQHTDYIYSGNRLLAWKDNQGWHENIYLNGVIIATVDNKQIHYHENDYQGKTLRLVDKKGETVWESHWQPYRESDSTQNGINNPQRFAGQILDEETGFYYNHFREYDPQTGRYTQSDPIGLNGGVNTYAYVGGNPVMGVDLLGLYTLDDAIKSLKGKGVVPQGDVVTITPSLKGFSMKSQSKSSRAYSAQQIYTEWHKMELKDLSWTKELPLCPRKLEDCKGEQWGEVTPANEEHEGGVSEVRTIDINGHSNQCVYDANGDIMLTIPAAGTADFQSCSRNGCIPHAFHDYFPWLMAKKLGKKAEEQYYEVRPPLVEPE